MKLLGGVAVPLSPLYSDPLQESDMTTGLLIRVIMLGQTGRLMQYRVEGKISSRKQSKTRKKKGC